MVMEMMVVGKRFRHGDSKVFAQNLSNWAFT